MSVHPVIQDLLADRPVLTDGAWGTQLQERGLGIGDFPDAWNLTHPEQVQAVAQSYGQAGSRVILTNTFGANRFRMREHAIGLSVADINARGVELSRAGASTEVLVFASIGPSGKLLMSGEVTAEQLLQAFREQASALASAGANGLVLETMSDLAEARIAIAAARETGLPVVASMVFDTGNGRDRTMMGTSPEEAARELTKAGADVIGANCGQGVEGFAAICRRLRASTDRPIWIKANAGLPKVIEGKAVYNTTPGQFASHIPELLEAGASFFGGCCGTSPEFIAAARKTISRR